MRPAQQEALFFMPIGEHPPKEGKSSPEIKDRLPAAQRISIYDGSVAWGKSPRNDSGLLPGTGW
jgi:hypothetical protein